MSHPLTIYKASAGSGKTFTLATEYIKLLVRNPQNYRQILAVTFTNKATEEMKMRILSQLYGIWRGFESSKAYADKVMEGLNDALSRSQMQERAGQALHLLLHNYSYFRVETIDSFFQSVMRDLARELNLTANLRLGLNDKQVEEMAVDKLIDSLSSTDMLLQWLMKYIMDTISDDQSWNVIGEIKKYGMTIFQDFYKSHREQLKQLSEEKDFFIHYQEQLREIRRQSRERMEAIAASFFDTIEAEGLTVNDFAYGKNGVAGFFLKLQKGCFDETVVGSRVTDCIGQPDKWCNKKHKRQTEIIELADSTLCQILRYGVEQQPLQWKLYKSAELTIAHLNQLRLLSSIEQKVREINNDQNRFLLSDTQQLLHELIDGSDTPFIFEKIGAQLEHIMIDEFQDTSTVQWKNFKVLLEETMSRSGSENLIVGDVKQSIYRWRSGDWRLLAGITDEFPHSKEMVHVEPLDINYRSDRRVVDFNNAFFTEAARQEQITAYDDVYQRVPSKKGQEGYVRVSLLPAADYEQQALEALSDQVGELLASGIPPTDIAILVRVNKIIPDIATHLMQRLPGLKVVSNEAFRLDASSSVVTIMQGIRYLTHPDDVIAHAYLAKAYTGSIDGDLPEEFTPALLRLPLYELTERLFAIFHLDQAEQQSAYVCAFFDQVVSFAADNGSDIDAFLREWDESLFKKTIQSPEADGLRIISIHQSKGLEYPYVLIPHCNWKLELDEVLWTTPQEKPFSQLPLIPVKFSKTDTAGTIYEEAYQEEHFQNIVDNINLLYVGFTRASKCLIVYGKRKATALFRSKLIESVLPEVAKQLKGSTLEGIDNPEVPIIFEYGSLPVPKGKTPSTAKAKEPNPFLQESTTVKVHVDIFPTQVNFKQSNKSSDFISKDDNEENSQADYIQLGSVLHNVLSTIRSTDDVEEALNRMEQEGVLYNGSLTRQHLVDLLRHRLASPHVAEWFEPGRWTLYNECTILTTDALTGKVTERRPDRVMTDGKETIVVDFKFGREREEYHEQVRQYMQLLREMGQPAVKGYLWLVYSNNIIEVTSLPS